MLLFVAQGGLLLLGVKRRVLLEITAFCEMDVKIAEETLGLSDLLLLLHDGNP